MVGARLSFQPRFDVAEPSRRLVQAGIGSKSKRLSRRRLLRKRLSQRRQIVHVEARVPLVRCTPLERQLGALANRSHRAPGEKSERRGAGAHAGEISNESTLYLFASFAFRFPHPQVQALAQRRRGNKERLAHFRASDDLPQLLPKLGAIALQRLIEILLASHLGSEQPFAPPEEVLERQQRGAKGEEARGCDGRRRSSLGFALVRFGHRV